MSGAVHPLAPVFGIQRAQVYKRRFRYVEICGNKMPTRCNRGFIADLIACSTCFGHHYAHHQELKSIIQWLLPVVFRAVKM